jgi:hypothetical protein
MIYIRLPLVCLNSYQHPNFDKLTLVLSVTCRFFDWYINMVFILRNQSVEKSLLEISRFNLSADFVGVLIMHFVELKKRFLLTAPIHLVWYILNILECLEVSKCVSHLKYVLHSCSSYCFKAYHHPNFINLLDCSRLHIGFLPDILPWYFIWGPNR